MQGVEQVSFSSGRLVGTWQVDDQTGRLQVGNFIAVQEDVSWQLYQGNLRWSATFFIQLLLCFEKMGCALAFMGNGVSTVLR